MQRHTAGYLLAAAAAVVLSLWGASETEAHGVVCTADSGDQKSGNMFYYTAVSSCPYPVEENHILIYLEKYNWNTNTWVNQGLIDADYNYVQATAVVNNGFPVSPYYGLNCVRIKARHTIWHHNSSTATTWSSPGGRCY